MKYLNLSITVIITILLFACSEKPEKSLWDLESDYDLLPNPVISSIEPADGAYAGIDEVTINGSNFLDDKSEINVYFSNESSKNSLEAEIVESSTSQIKAIVPANISGDSIIIKVQVNGALEYAKYEPGYKVEFAALEYGGVTGQSNAYGIACDLDENLYVSLGEGKIIKIDTEENQTDYLTEGDGVDGFYGAMKIGPNGDLYAARTKYIYRAVSGEGTISKFTTTKIKQAVNDFDFDEYGDIYIAAKKGIYFVETDDASSFEAASYSDFTLNSVRVFNGYVYVAGTFSAFTTPEVQEGIWRNEILAENGSLGPTELVVDWGAKYANETIPSIKAITFSGDGYLYIGADSTDNSDAVTFIPPEADGTYSIENAEPLYSAVLMPPSTVFCWGNDQYLYVNRKSVNNDVARIIKITMGKMSAPNYGRQ